MKVLLTTISLILLKSLAFCQTDTTLIEFDNASLPEVISQLHDTYNINFSYSSNMLEAQNVIVSGKFKGKTPPEILSVILRNTSIEFFYKDDIIILRLKQLETPSIITGVIRDANSGLGVPYATVEVKGKLVGAICDYRGVYLLEVPIEFKNDTIQVSSMGYEKFVFTSSSQNPDTIDLKPKQYLLPTLEVESKGYKSQVLGLDAKKAKGELYMDTHGQQTALFIETDSQVGKIEKIRYYLSEKGNTNAPFRVRIYDVDTTTNGPGKDILKQFLVVQPDVTRGWYEINVWEYDLDIPEGGFFVAMEGVYPNDYEAFIQMNPPKRSNKIMKRRQAAMQQILSYGQKLGYKKSKKYRTWHYSLSRTWFQLDQPFDVLISVDVLVE